MTSTSFVGRRRTPDASRQIKHYAIAQGEAVESACSLDVMRLERTITDRYNRGIELLEHIIATLTGLINKPE